MKSLHKNIASVLVALSLSISSFAVSANNFGHGDKPNKSKSVVTIAELSVEESEILESLEIEMGCYTIDQVLTDLLDTPTVAEIRVYNQNGELVHLQKGCITPEAVPAAAELMLSDKGVQYYFLQQ